MTIEAFKLAYRQGKAAAHAQSPPGQAGEQLALEQARPVANGVPEAGCFAKQGLGQNVQRQAVEGRLEPPEQKHG